MSEGPIIELKNICKRFDGIEALTDISLAIERGKVHGLVGENGAGKSTLGKIIAGVHRPDNGQLIVDGEAVHFTTPRDALGYGIAMISQEVSLIPKRTVVENVFLGIESTKHWLVDKKELYKRYDELTARAGIYIHPDTILATLRIADQKKVEVLRAVARNARLIVMDEPTAALSSEEAAALYALIDSLKVIGTTVVYVSHFLEEVLQLADSVTVLRNGRLIKTSPVAEETPESLVNNMLGGFVSLSYPEKNYPEHSAPVVLSVQHLCKAGDFEDISFEIREGEIVGLAGLAGSGRSEICRALFGAEKITGGTVSVKGNIIQAKTPRDAVREGIALLPESRKIAGLIMNFSTSNNITLPHLTNISVGPMIKLAEEKAQTQSILTQLDVRPPDPLARVSSLSGGNQQKTLFAKWLFKKPLVFIADEPTAGVDVGAKRAIYQLIHQLAGEGLAVLLVSSDIEEVLGLSHKVLAIRKGRIVMEFDRHEIAEEKVMNAIFATDKEGDPKCIN